MCRQVVSATCSDDGLQEKHKDVASVYNKCFIDKMWGAFISFKLYLLFQTVDYKLKFYVGLSEKLLFYD